MVYISFSVKQKDGSMGFASSEYDGEIKKPSDLLAARKMLMDEYKSIESCIILFWKELQ